MPGHEQRGAASRRPSRKSGYPGEDGGVLPASRPFAQAALFAHEALSTPVPGICWVSA